MTKAQAHKGSISMHIRIVGVPLSASASSVSAVAGTDKLVVAQRSGNAVGLTGAIEDVGVKVKSRKEAQKVTMYDSPELIL
jgi:hypothetical protein